MDPSNLLSQIDQLDDDIDDLEDAVEPLIQEALAVTSSKLPVLDKAKLYVLTTYAIESLLFSYLRLNGVKAREHPVFKELTRVKQYFDKIKQAESPEAKKPQVSLDKDAAKRFIAAGLSGNDQLDASRAKEQKEREARKIAEGSAAHKDVAEGVQLPSRKRAADVSDSSSSSSSDSEVEATPPKKKKTNKKKVAKNETMADVESTKKSEKDKKRKKKASSNKKSKKSAV